MASVQVLLTGVDNLDDLAARLAAKVSAHVIRQKKKKHPHHLDSNSISLGLAQRNNGVFGLWSHSMLHEVMHHKFIPSILVESTMPIALKGWDAVSSEIEDDGTVHNICIGTMGTEDVNYYMNRPFFDNDTHGAFAVIFAGIEA